MLALGQYNFLVQYKPGSSIGHADCLSRQQLNNADENISFAIEPYINVLRSGKQIRKQRTEDETTLGMALPGLEKLSVENLREAQENDYWFGAMIKYIINNELPSTRKFVNSVDKATALTLEFDIEVKGHKLP